MVNYEGAHNTVSILSSFVIESYYFVWILPLSLCIWTFVLGDKLIHVELKYVQQKFVTEFASSRPDDVIYIYN